MANSSLSEHAFARPTLIGCHVVTFFDSTPSAENPRCTIGQTNRTRACQGVFALYYNQGSNVICRVAQNKMQAYSFGAHSVPQLVCPFASNAARHLQLFSF